MPEVSLVSMPYVALERPSMALGLLAAILQRDGIDTEVVYGNLQFANANPLSRNVIFGDASPEYCIGDWTFASAAFRDDALDPEPFLSLTCNRLHGRVPERKPELRSTLLSVRQSAEQFTSELAAQLVERKPLIVGCTSTFQQHVSSLALLRCVKELAPEIVTILGGANCETTMGAATHRNFPWVDYVVSGEADGFISHLCKLIFAHGRSIPLDLLPHGVLGRERQWFALSDSKVNERPRAVTEQLQGLPVPMFDSYFDSLARLPIGNEIRPALSMETSRGCWWGQKAHCTFCGLNGNGMGYRSRPADEVLQEFAALSERYKVNKFEMVDNILDMKYFRTVLPELASQGGRYRLFFEVKSNLTYDHLTLLRDAGVTWIQPGIESLHSDILKLMNKGVRASTNLLLMKWSSELGIRLSWSLLYGFPFEKLEWYEEMASWFPLICHLQPPSSLAYIRVDRYSPYHQSASKYGLSLVPAEMYQHVYPVPRSDLDDLVYFFDRDDSLPPDSPSYGIGRYAPIADKIRQIIGKWTRAFWHEKRLLCMEDDGEQIRMLDTRPGAVETSYSLRGLNRQVLLSCEQGPSRSSLTEELRKNCGVVDASPDDIDEALADLKDRRLLLELDGRFINLALQKIPTLTSNEDFPGGYAFPV